MKRNNLLHIITATTFLILLLLLVLFPNNSFNAAKNGLYIWLNNVLPALLPFFFGSEILIGLGVIPVSYTHLDVYKRQNSCRVKCIQCSLRG